MRVLVVGAGGVGSAIASIAARRDVFEHIVLADVDHARAARAATRTESAPSAGHQGRCRRPARPGRVDPFGAADVVVNACDPRFNPPIFDAAFTAGCHYLDMAMHMSSPTPPIRTISAG